MKCCGTLIQAKRSEKLKVFFFICFSFLQNNILNIEIENNFKWKKLIETNETKMGYCAKVRIYSHIYCVIVALFITKQVYDVQASSKGKSWPSMKTYDIWGSTQNQAESLHTQRGSKLTSNDLEIKDYRDKTSFRNEKGMETHKKLC